MTDTEECVDDQMNPRMIAAGMSIFALLKEMERAEAQMLIDYLAASMACHHEMTWEQWMQPLRTMWDAVQRNHAIALERKD